MNKGIKTGIVIASLLWMSIGLVLVANAQQDIMRMTLQEVIGMARTESPDAFLARHRYRASYWEYRTHVANYLPSLSLSADLPSIERSISKVTLPDGEDAFVERSLANSSASLSLSKNLGLTGGRLFVNTDLERIDLFSDSTVTSYLSSPFYIGIVQPIFSYNEYRWDKKIEPLKFEEAKREYLTALEEISISAIGLFFDLARSQLDVQIAEVNYKNNDTLYKIAQGRYNIGTIPANELLQMELSLLRSDADLNEAYLDLEMKKFELRSFLGLPKEQDIELLISANVPGLHVDVDKALEMAKKNNPDIISMERLLIEAERDVKKAKVENAFNANLYASFGLTQSAIDLKGAYKDPEDQQRLSLGVEVPILDWGLGKGKYKMALSNQEVTKISVQQDLVDFEQDLYLQVMQFNLQEKQLMIAYKSDSIAQNRYDVTKQRFLIGKIDVTDLNIALSEKDDAKRNFYLSLRSYWNYYYSLRRMTLYDFQTAKEIETDYDKLIE